MGHLETSISYPSLILLAAEVFIRPLSSTLYEEQLFSGMEKTNGDTNVGQARYSALTQHRVSYGIYLSWF